jgi:hypothetical protein
VAPVKILTCRKCGRTVGEMEKGRLMKGAVIECPNHADPDGLRTAADAFAKNKRQPDLMDTFESIFGKGFGK